MKMLAYFLQYENVFRKCIDCWRNVVHALLYPKIIKRICFCIVGNAAT